MEADVTLNRDDYNKLVNLLKQSTALKEHLNRLTLLSRPLNRHDIQNDTTQAFFNALEAAMGIEATENHDISDRERTNTTTRRRR